MSCEVVGSELVPETRLVRERRGSSSKRRRYLVRVLVHLHDNKENRTVLIYFIWGTEYKGEIDGGFKRGR